MDEGNVYNQIEIDTQIPLTLICEGKADEAFFKKIVEERGLRPFNIIASKGFEGIEQTLRAIRGNPQGFANTKGILIVADSRNDAAATFGKITAMIRRTNYGTIPAAPLTIAPGQPRLSVILLPGPNEPGSLESLCFEALVDGRDYLRDCVNTFLSCCKVNETAWLDEKLAKARFCALVAGTFRQDPSKALSYAFSRSKDGTPPMISTKHRIFDLVEQWLERFSDEATL